MRLQLTRRADYAVRAVLALTADDRRLPSAELARRMEIPPGFLPQILPALVKDGILARTLGRHGGYRLARAPHAISMLEVIEAADGPHRPRACVLRGGACRRELPCVVHHAVAEAQEATRAALSRADFAGLVARVETGAADGHRV